MPSNLNPPQGNSMPSVFKKDTVFKNFPTVEIITREKDNSGFINVTSGEHFTDASLHRDWQFCSVASYALSNKECPFDAGDRARKLGHELYFVITSPMIISSTKTKLPSRLLLSEDDIIRFEGKLFKIAPSPNYNIKLISYSQ
jgi:hypothetical protein